MADLIRALESDLFGSYEWSADLYEDLAAVPEAADRLAVQRGLLRAYEAMELRAESAMKAADAMVAAEAELTPEEGEAVAALEDVRERFFETSAPDAASAFVAAFDPLWTKGPRHALLADAILAALARSNVLASRRAGDPQALHRESAALYAEIGRMLQDRVSAGESIWKETAASAVNRRVVALRFAGDEAAARKLAEEEGAGEFVVPPNAADRRPPA